MKILLKLAKWLLILGILGGIAGSVTLAVLYYRISPTLPDVATLTDVKLQVPLRIYSRDGQLMQVYAEQRRMPVAMADVPPRVRQAFLAAEDARFYQHPGVDYQGITRAVWHIIKTGGEKGPGGSTITMQLARHFGLVSKEKSYMRKLREIFLALKMEKELSKDEILELYLNKAFLGSRAYGVVAAAETYYGKTLDELTLPEAAMLAGVPQRPGKVNPIVNPEAAIARRNYVLRQMLEQDFISQTAFDEALAEDDFAYLHQPAIELSAPYAAEMARSWAIEHLGDEAYTGGYEIHTTFDARLQQGADRALIAALRTYDERHGYRGAEQQAELTDQDGPDQWSAILEHFPAVGGLLPALVIEVDEQSATLHLADGQAATLSLEQLAWAKPYQEVDRVGDAPEAVTDVLTVGDVVRVARTDEGDWQLSQLPDVEGALVSLRPEDGAMLAVSGGFDFFHSKFNRAIQAKRQPGSSFKPFVYSAALDGDFTPATIVNDAPVVFRDETLERVWKPENYEQNFNGPTRLREGMIKSRNLISIRVLRDIGVRYTWDFVQRFGFDPNDIPQDLSMALGSGAVPPLAMARAYAALANGGYLVEPYFVDRVVDGEGNTVYQANPQLACEACPERVEWEREQQRLAMLEAMDSEPTAGDEEVESADSIDVEADFEVAATIEETIGPTFPAVPEGLQFADRALESSTRYLIDSILKDVVRRGTGAKALVLERQDLRGKTGTTNDQMDAWFSGYNEAVVATAWVGFDKLQPLGRGEVGGRAALPMWIDYMRVALEGVPEFESEMPNDVVFARINPDSGLLASASTPGSILEVFRRDNVPDRETSIPGLTADQSGAEADPYDIF